MSPNKKIYLIHFKYEKVFRKICSKVISKYNGLLPIEWEDIYYKFLYSIPKILKKFDPSIGVSEKTFLFLECQYFAKNQCRKYSSKKHSIMNLRSDLNYEDSIYISDSSVSHEPLDISLLTNFEVEIYKLYFLEQENITNISKKLNVSYYKISKAFKKVKSKLNLQLESN